MDMETELKLLRAQDITLTKDEMLGLCLEVASTGEVHQGVKPTLLFPLTGRTEFIRLTNQSDEEIGTIRTLESLDDDSQALLSEELSKAYFIPEITRVERIKEEYGTSHWTVVTDCGPKSFEVRDKRDVRFLDSKHLIIRDVDGNRFEILNFQALDEVSIHMLETEL